MKKAFSISLALLMLISNVGLAMNVHLCMGHAVEHTLSLGAENLSCGMMEMGKMQASSDDQKLNPIDCCDNLHQTLQLEDEFQIQVSSVAVNPLFLVTLVTTFIAPQLADQEPLVAFPYSPPPLSQPSEQVLFQSFLI